MALDHVKEFTKINNLQMGKSLTNNFNSYSPHYFLFIDASWTTKNRFGGLDFIIVGANCHIVVVECYEIEVVYCLNAKMQALEMEIHITKDWNIDIHTAFTDCL